MLFTPMRNKELSCLYVTAGTLTDRSAWVRTLIRIIGLALHKFDTGDLAMSVQARAGCSQNLSRQEH